MRLRDFLIVLCSTIIGANVVYNQSGSATWWMVAGAVGGLAVGVGIVALLRRRSQQRLEQRLLAKEAAQGDATTAR